MEKELFQTADFNDDGEASSTILSVCHNTRLTLPPVYLCFTHEPIAPTKKVLALNSYI